MASCFGVGERVPIPKGYAIVGSQWKGSKLVSKLKDWGNITFGERLDHIDIFAPSQLAILIIEEIHLTEESSVRRSVSKLRQVIDYKGVVLVKRQTSSQSFLKIQKFITLDLGLVCIPYNDADEVSCLLPQLVFMENESKVSKGPHLLKSADEKILETLSVIPNLGLAKSKLLLEKFKTLSAICNLKEEELSDIVGQNTAFEIKRFFTKNVQTGLQ